LALLAFIAAAAASIALVLDVVAVEVADDVELTAEVAIFILLSDPLP
jgi:hypothetical protein